MLPHHIMKANKYSATEDEEYSQPSLMQRTMIENADWFSSFVIVKCQGAKTCNALVINMEWGNFGSSHFPRTSFKIDLDVENQNINDQRGVLVYLRGHEGRDTGTGHKLHAYNLQDDGRDTVEANEELSLPVDSRKYGIGAQILRDVGVKTMKLMTNNVAKYSGLKGYGLEFLVRVPLSTTISKHNKAQQEIS
ncbi:bifunctional riboflavin biosynthesis protein RIBA 1, chloroplastic-like protein [Tanacetum coccineum]